MTIRPLFNRFSWRGKISLMMLSLWGVNELRFLFEVTLSCVKLIESTPASLRSPPPWLSAFSWFWTDGFGASWLTVTETSTFDKFISYSSYIDWLLLSSIPSWSWHSSEEKFKSADSLDWLSCSIRARYALVLFFYTKFDSKLPILVLFNGLFEASLGSVFKNGFFDKANGFECFYNGQSLVFENPMLPEVIFGEVPCLVWYCILLVLNVPYVDALKFLGIFEFPGENRLCKALYGNYLEFS